PLAATLRVRSTRCTRTLAPSAVASAFASAARAPAGTRHAAGALAASTGAVTVAPPLPLPLPPALPVLAPGTPSAFLPAAAEIVIAAARASPIENRIVRAV